MLTYLRTSIFDSPAQTLVNTVNTVGVMGKGLAKTFKEKYPEMFNDYKKLCVNDKIKVGTLFLWRGADKWVLNFPTKTTWRKPSQLDYLEAGLKKFAKHYEEAGITSISFPPLGCGNGELAWPEVKSLMEKYLRELPLQIYIHEKFVPQGYVPEHKEITAPIPDSFELFLNDIKGALLKQKGAFETLRSDFTAIFSENNTMVIKKKDGSLAYIPEEALSLAWGVLQSGFLSKDQFNSPSSSINTSYLFPVLSSLPYVDTTIISDSHNPNERKALYFKNVDLPSPRRTFL